VGPRRRRALHGPHRHARGQARRLTQYRGGHHPRPGSPSGRRIADASMGGHRRQAGNEMTFVTLTITCARSRGALAAALDMAAVDTCVRGRTYFVGHNQGVFTPLMHMGPGSLITWYDARGAVHRYRVVAVRDAAGGAHPLTTSSHRVDAQFQTCALANGSV